MTTRRFALWLLVWLAGWGLWMRYPLPHWFWGQILILIAARWLIVPRVQPAGVTQQSVKSQIVIPCGLVVILAVAVMVPSLFRWVWSTNPGFVLAGRIVGGALAAFGVVVQARQIVPRGEQHAA